jgi:hypothetical protein
MRVVLPALDPDSEPGTREISNISHSPALIVVLGVMLLKVT